MDAFDREEREIIHQRNRLLVRLLWLFYMLNLMKFFFDPRATQHGIWLGLLVLSAMTLAIHFPSIAHATMVCLISLTFFFFYALLYLSPYPANYIFLWLGLIMSALYQSYVAVLLAGALACFGNVFFFYVLGDIIMPGVTLVDLFYPLSFTIFVTIFLLFLTRFTKKLWHSAEQSRQHIQHLAYHDSLTELPNRTLFQEVATERLKRANQLGLQAAVIFFDLTDFKQVNDSLGHAAGDQLLRAVAQRLKQNLRHEDMLCRLGGDEFIALVDICEEADIAIITDRITESLAHPFLLNGSEVYVNCSMGVSLFPVHSTDLANLVQQADTAMYRAKDAGVTTWFLYDKKQP